MLFEMYETYSEKAAPDVYKGLPIVDRDDLMRALQDAAGYELAAMVVKYLNKVERQAQEKIDAKMEEAEHDATEAEEAKYALHEMERALYDVACDFGDILARERLNRDKLHKVFRKLIDIYWKR